MMPAAARDRQTSVRIANDTDAWLLKMFNEAAADVTAEDREERESLLGGFAGGLTSRAPHGAFALRATPPPHPLS